MAVQGRLAGKKRADGQIRTQLGLMHIEKVVACCKEGARSCTLQVPLGHLSNYLPVIAHRRAGTDYPALRHLSTRFTLREYVCHQRVLFTSAVIDVWKVPVRVLA